MSLLPFNDPPQQVIARREFEHALNIIKDRHRAVPHDVFERWRSAAEGHLSESGRYQGMDKNEFPQYMKSLHMLTPEAYRGVLGDLQTELQKALDKSMYGSATHF